MISALDAWTFPVSILYPARSPKVRRGLTSMSTPAGCFLEKKKTCKGQEPLITVRPRLTLGDLAGYEIDTGKVHACKSLNMALRN